MYLCKYILKSLLTKFFCCCNFCIYCNIFKNTSENIFLPYGVSLQNPQHDETSKNKRLHRNLLINRQAHVLLHNNGIFLMELQ